MWQWQDIVLTIINFGFMVTAIPAVLRNYRHKEAKSQSLSMYLITAILLTVKISWQNAEIFNYTNDQRIP